MGSFFSILNRIFPFFVFFLLEVISFYTISNNNAFYETKFINQSNLIVNGFYRKVQNFNDYFALRTNNEQLVAENAKLYQKSLEFQEYKQEEIRDSIVGSDESKIQKMAPTYRVSDARIINNSHNNLRNYLIIDKGATSGIKKDMGIVTDRGPVGMVVDVTDNYACVMSFLNKDASISAKLKNLNIAGQLKWGMKDYRIAYLEDIPRHIKVNKGDLVVTSGYSSYFPINIPIGRVVNVKKDKSYNFSKIEVLLFNDFTKLEYVYAIENIHQEELEKLNKEIDTLQNSAQ